MNLLNISYSVLELSYICLNRYPNRFTNLESARTSVSRAVKGLGIKDINNPNKKKKLLISKNDSMLLFEYLDDTWTKHKSDDDAEKKNKTCTVNFGADSKNASELIERSNACGVSKLSIVENALNEYFKNHPFEKYEYMSKAELIKRIKELEGKS